MNKKTGIAAMCMFALLAAGCGKDERTVQTAKGEVKVTQKGGTTTMEMKDKSGKVTVTAGDKGVALPDKFPADVPIMTGGVVKMAMVMGDKLNVSFTVAATQADTLKYYEESLKSQGWKVDATVNMGEAAMLRAKKDKREVMMTVAKEGSGSIVQLVVPQDKS